MKEKMISITLVLSMIVAILVGCGKKEEVSVSVQEQSNEYLQEEEADEIAEIAEELSKEENFEDETDISDDDNEYINSCFDELLDNTLIVIDKKALCMTEEELVATYGNPKQKKNNYLNWELEESGNDKANINLLIKPKNPVNDYRVGINDTTLIYAVYLAEVKEYVEKYGSADFSTISDYFDNYEFNDAYEFSTLSTYSDFVDKIGYSGMVQSITNSLITVAWYFPSEERVLEITFYLDTGKVVTEYGVNLEEVRSREDAIEQISKCM